MMKMPDGYQGFQDIKPGICLREGSLRSKQLKKLSPWDELHDDDVEVLSLDKMMGFDYEGMIEWGGNLKLIFDKFQISRLL